MTILYSIEFMMDRWCCVKDGMSVFAFDFGKLSMVMPFKCQWFIFVRCVHYN